MSDIQFERRAVVKAAGKKQILYCVVLEPDTEDLQGDVLSADEIEKVAHTYATDSRLIGDGHRKQPDGTVVPADAQMVETFIAPVDFESNGELIRKGSWVMAIRVNDVEMWNNVETGEIDGLSIGGTGIRTPV